MSVWLNRDTTQGKVYGAVVVRAGAIDSPNTGIAHYFEHMAFKGTGKIGTTDYAAEKPLLDSMETLYERLGVATCKEERAEVLSRISELHVRVSKYAVAGELDRLYSLYGASELNAFTSYDLTAYHNSFSPQYMAQWCEISSERLLDPVLRLFPSELETVYEEKNMYGDMLGMSAVERLAELYFAPSPYAHPIIGSTQNLKNPSMRAVREFVRRNYVGSNMGIVLCGDFDTMLVMPMLEKSFGRIDKGVPVERNYPKPRPIKGIEKADIRVPIPFVKASAMGFRADSGMRNSDRVGLEMIVSLINNENGTGLVDRLMAKGDILAGVMVFEPMQYATVLGVGVVPKLFFQSNDRARDLVWGEINKIKRGEISDEDFLSAKAAYKRKLYTQIENIDSRADVMIKLMGEGREWSNYLEQLSQIESIGKDDLAVIARRYLGDHYMLFTKRSGRYPKERIEKPDLAHASLGKSAAESDYALMLAKMPIGPVKPRFIDFRADATRIPIGELATLVHTQNGVNDIFSLDVDFTIGSHKEPRLVQLASYLVLLGADSLSYERFNARLRTLGATTWWSIEPECLRLNVKGLDANFEATMDLVTLFLRSVRGDKKKLSKVKQMALLEKISQGRSTMDIAQALNKKVLYGQNSPYLNRLTLSEIRGLKSEDLLDLFHRMQRSEFMVAYCGGKSPDSVARILGETLSLDTRKPLVGETYHLPPLNYDTPTVFFVADTKATQSVIASFSNIGHLNSDSDRAMVELYNRYFGQGMTSLLFRELRELRSFAYNTSGRLVMPSDTIKDGDSFITSMLSTQADKTIEALTVLDSLIALTPELGSAQFTVVQTQAINDMCNSFPSMRQIAPQIASLLLKGYSVDPLGEAYDKIATKNAGHLADFHERHIAGKRVVYMVVGNPRRVNVKSLERFGRVVKLKKNDLYK